METLSLQCPEAQIPPCGTHCRWQGLWVPRRIPASLLTFLARKYIYRQLMGVWSRSRNISGYTRILSPLTGEEDGACESHYQVKYRNVHMAHMCFPPHGTQGSQSVVCALPVLTTGCIRQFGKVLGFLNFKGRNWENLQQIWDSARLTWSKAQNTCHETLNTVLFFIISEKSNAFACAAENSETNVTFRSQEVVTFRQKKTALHSVHICVVPTATAKIFFFL